MKALALRKYGAPRDLLVEDFDVPIPSENQVLVKIKSSSLNATDFEYVRGNFFARLTGGLRKPKNYRLGCDFSGVVESVGTKVTKFKQGDEVYADLLYNSPSYGAIAEYVTIPEMRLRMKPKTLTFEEAATIPQAGVLAVQGIHSEGKAIPGAEVLINGAGGGVGTYAIQLAKHFGAQVTAVDHSKKFELMKRLGADHTLDYTKVDFTKTGKKYDLIVDVIARRGVFAYRRALKPGGIYRMVGGDTRKIFQILILGSILSIFSNKKVGVLMGRPNDKEDMQLLTQLIKEETVKPIVDKTFSLNDSAEALQYLEDGHALGKIVINFE